jgi:hypothetical protein
MTNTAHAVQAPAAQTPAPAPAPAPKSRLHALAGTIIFDVAGPYLAYSQLHAHGVSDARALVISGAVPAAGVILGVIRKHRVDVLGLLVLSGIIVGAVLGLLTGSARLVLLEGSVPTALASAAFFGSLLTSRPLLFRLAAEFAGEGTAQAAKMTAAWAEPAFQAKMRLMTAVWGAGLAAEALIRVAVVETTSVSTALLISKLLPWTVTGLLLAWTLGYRHYATARRARHAAQAA